MDLHSTPAPKTISNNFMEIVTQKIIEGMKTAYQDIINDISFVPKQIIDKTECSIRDTIKQAHNRIQNIVTGHISEIDALKQEAMQTISPAVICFITLKHQIDLHMNAIYSTNNLTIANTELEAEELTDDTNNLIDSMENSWNEFSFRYNDIDGIRKEFDGIVNQANSIMHRADLFFTLTLPAMSKSIINNIDHHSHEIDLAMRNTLTCIRSVQNQKSN